MSGGIDSTVSAFLLKEKGYDLLGITMVHLDKEVANKARKVADDLAIEHKVYNLTNQFEQQVINYFCKTYEKCATPNPCVECNNKIKFGLMLDIALELGCDMVATGHYARVEYNLDKKRFLLKKGVDKQKDQSYFLYGLNQHQLSRIVFPLGDLTKQQVREIAREKGVENAETDESQEICFIPGDYRDFLQDKITYRPGDIVDLKGNILGKHKGLPFYTIGQRKGLGISAGRIVYVVDIDNKNNRLIVDEEKHLFSCNLTSNNNNLIYYDKIETPIQVQAKIRYRACPADATIVMNNDIIETVFHEPQRAITKGQSAVYYIDEYVVGGGVIS